jgi:hypothetical protein
LHGVTISIVINGGLFSTANEAKFKTEIKGLEEQANMYISGEAIKAQADYTSAMLGINAGYENLEKLKKYYPEIDEMIAENGQGETITSILSNIPNQLKDKIIIHEGEFYYIYNPTDKSDKQKVKWCFDTNVKVWGYESQADFDQNAEEEEIEYIHDGRYEKVKGVYMCIPDLTGFVQLHTRYVSWDDSGNEQIGTWTIKTPPENWYDYKNSKWANVVVENNGKEAWYVWIPRYVYKIIDSTGQAEPPLDIKFVDKQNNWTNPENDQTTTWEDLQILGYQLPEAFIWSDTEGDQAIDKQLAGYWGSKYEISGVDKLLIDMDLVTGDTSIEIRNINFPASGGLSTGQIATYEHYINAKLIKTTTSQADPVTKTGLKPGTEYTINLTAKDANGKVLASTTKTVRTSRVNPPDLTGFNQATTYYLTYKENGDEERLLVAGNSPPNNWYDYADKKWANIVTTSEDGAKEAYWVWIPRYAYKTMYNDVNAATAYADIIFLKGITRDIPLPGYTIPEAFIWSDTEGDTAEGKQITGYWASKYEISN